MNRKPTKLKILEGNLGRRPLPKNEPEPKPLDSKKIPNPPKDINNEAKKIWNRLAPILAKNGLLTEADIDSLALLCQTRAYLIEIHEKINKEDSLNENNSKQRYYTQQFRLLAHDFGLSPRGRVGLSISQDGETF